MEGIVDGMLRREGDYVDGDAETVIWAREHGPALATWLVA